MHKVRLYRNVILTMAQYDSALVSFDILKNFANLEQRTINDLVKVIDDPSNGFLLEPQSHGGFDEYLWSLSPKPGVSHLIQTISTP